MAGALDGLRVVDCSWGTAGPMATGQLADHGATVLRVEPPGGDPFRGLSTDYAVYNRGKQSIVLDLKAEAGKSALHRFLDAADVFVESWRPGVANSLGLGYGDLHERYPCLVYCSISGYGQNGPDRDRPGYESLVLARMGLMGMQDGVREGPIFLGMPTASYGAAFLAAIGIIAALYRERVDGVGRHVDTSLADGALGCITMWWHGGERPAPRLGQLDPHRRLIVTSPSSFLCGDREYLGVHTGAVGAHSRCMEVLGLANRIVPAKGPVEMAELLTDEDVEILARELPRIFASRPREEWLRRLLQAEVCAVPVLRPGEVFDQPQVLHNRMAIEVIDPELGRVTQLGVPAHLSETPGEVRGAAPRIDEHADRISAATGWGLDRVQAMHSPMATAPAAVKVAVLDGIKVLDFGQFFAGPYGARLLADLGADVIKLEPLEGDGIRPLIRVFFGANRGKRDIAVNLRDPAGQKIALELAAWADVAIHNMRPGAAERLGLGYEQMRAANPSLIYVHAPGWGSSGPDARRQSFAPLLAGLAGLHHESAGAGNPPIAPVANEDYANPFVFDSALMMALLHRQQTGKGQFIEVPQVSSTMSLAMHVMRLADGTVIGTKGLDQRQLGTHALNRLYQTVDGWICVVVRTDAEFRRLCDVLELKDTAEDKRFADWSGRRQHTAPLAIRLEAAFAKVKTDECATALQTAGVPCEIPRRDHEDEFFGDPANLAVGRVEEYPHPDFGRLREIARMIRISDTTPPAGHPAPRLGEQTTEILAKLSYSAAEVQDLFDRRIVR